jgi:hypothetical protein
MADFTPEQRRLDRLERATAQLALVALDVKRADVARAAVMRHGGRGGHSELIEILNEYGEELGEGRRPATVQSLGQAAAGADDPERDAELLAQMEREAGERPQTT